MMLACENVIVTMRMPGGASIDLELPVFLPVEELGKKILETMRIIRPKEFNAVAKLRFHFGAQALNDCDTLASVGVWDGSYLDVAPEKEANKEA